MSIQTQIEERLATAEPEVEVLLAGQGWEKPWSPDLRTWIRDAPLVKAPVIALAVVRALEALGCEVADLEVTLTREESAPG